MTLREMIDALRRRWVVVLAVTALAFVLGIGVVVAQGTEYRATSTVLLNQRETALPGNEGLLTQQKLNLLVVTYAEIVESGSFVDDALEDAGLTRDGATVHAESTLNASVLRISADDDNAEHAVDVADAVTRHLADVVEDGSGGVPTAADMTAVTLERPAAARQTQSGAFLLLVALVVGLALGGTLALLLDSE